MSVSLPPLASYGERSTEIVLCLKFHLLWCLKQHTQSEKPAQFLWMCHLIQSCLYPVSGENEKFGGGHLGDNDLEWQSLA